MTSGDWDDVVIVGASLAGLRVATVLRTEGYTGNLTVIGGEEETYDRPPLSKAFLAGTVDVDGIQLRGRDIEANWLLGATATQLDLDRRQVETDSAGTVSYDALVIATGSSPRRLPAFPVDRRRVLELRTLADAVALKEAARTASRVVIVGAGFIGVELASTCTSLGLSVDLVAPQPPLANLGQHVSQFAAGLCSAHGVTVHQNRTAAGVVNREDGVELELDDGSRLAADFVVVAIGAVPEVAWLRTSELDVTNGVSCDVYGHVEGLDNVFAAGDVCTWPGPDGVPTRVEHWSNAIEQGAIVARQLVHGRGDGPPPVRVPSAWSDHFGTRMQSIGHPHLADAMEIVEGSPAKGRFAVEAYRNGDLVGVVGYELPAVIARYRMRLAQQHVPA